MASPCRPRAVLFGRHASEDITREDAEASIEAVRAIRAHVDRVIAAQIDELVPARQKGLDHWRGIRLESARARVSAPEDANAPDAARADPDPSPPKA